MPCLARRLLLAERRDPKVLPRLRKQIADKQNPRLALQSLWALYVSGGFDEKSAGRWLAHPNENVRRKTQRTAQPQRRAGPMVLKIQPLTPSRWDDFAQLFGKNGACAGCWCMWWRLPRAQWVKQKGGGNKTAIRKLVTEGTVPGILAYADRQPIGWCAIGPREAYPRLANSRILKPVDGQAVWSITCFFVARPFRDAA